MVAFATMHAKERAVARPFQRQLDATLVVPGGIDTDRYGSFSGEVPRHGTMLDAARAKAQFGLRLSGLPHALASEGSFGPHPHLPFMAADTELLLFEDRDRGLEITETLLTFRTNYNQTTARTIADLEDFLAAARFPHHALIVRPNRANDGGSLDKGIADAARLDQAIRRSAAASEDGLARIETDMRANHNPTRMAVIRALASRLAARLRRCCPSCATPGFGSAHRLTGRPCAWCAEATALTMGRRISCDACGHCETTLTPSAPADPRYCPRCNP